jgi:hypothetical protein
VRRHHKNQNIAYSEQLDSVGSVSRHGQVDPAKERFQSIIGLGVEVIYHATGNVPQAQTSVAFYLCVQASWTGVPPCDLAFIGLVLRQMILYNLKIPVLRVGSARCAHAAVPKRMKAGSFMNTSSAEAVYCRRFQVPSALCRRGL